MVSMVSQMKEGFPFKFLVRLMLKATSVEVILLPLAKVRPSFNFTVRVKPSSENS